ncbi:MAG TPA: PP2C family protein-serine/threonine phosphatase [Candidatus Acidoferrales bacterium]|nr:PP2C family protein-serine/threonine phosphatase [Candidatus Acidoferrales bacterium]
MPDTKRRIRSISSGIETPPDRPTTVAHDGGVSTTELVFENTTAVAAKALAEHLFANSDRSIAGISYAVKYKLAEGNVGGDLIDVYHFDNDEVAIAVADIAGKGTQAAVQAAMIKYGLRAYASHGLSPERVLRSLDRLYLENNAFESRDSFASVFFGKFDPTRRLFTYACAAHEPVILMQPGRPARMLEVTAPLIGVFDDQHHLFKQAFVSLEAGSLLVATTDGVTEARNGIGDFFGLERLIALVTECRDLPETAIVDRILRETEEHCHGRRRDDIAIIAVRVS